MKFLKLFLALIAIALIVLSPKLKRLYHAIYLFEEDRIIENFRTFEDHFPTSELAVSPNPVTYPNGKSYKLPTTFEYEGQEKNTQDFLENSTTTGLLILQNDSIRFEQYYNGNTETTENISWSMAKSFVSALVGIAVEEGHIKHVMEPIETYVPELKGSGYEGVLIKDILQMSTGVKFNEDYGDFNSDISRWGRGFALGNSQDKFATSLVREREPGTFNHYVSINTHVLGMLIARATGKSVTEYLQEKLWNPVGMEHTGYWVTDSDGVELSLGGLNTTLRNYAKIGSVYMNKGQWKGKQIVPMQWVRASTNADASHLVAGDNPNSTSEYGYGYQWWLPASEEGEFMAQGVYNQNIYVNPITKTVIVKLSANHLFNDKSYPPSRSEMALALFRKITKQIGEKAPIEKVSSEVLVVE